MGSYLVFEEIKPSPTTQNIADGEFQDVKRNVGDQSVNPDNSSPSPPHSFYPCKAPIGINSYDSCNLLKNQCMSEPFVSHLLASKQESMPPLTSDLIVHVGSRLKALMG